MFLTALRPLIYLLVTCPENPMNSVKKLLNTNQLADALALRLPHKPDYRRIMLPFSRGCLSFSPP